MQNTDYTLFTFKFSQKKSGRFFVLTIKKNKT